MNPGVDAESTISSFNWGFPYYLWVMLVVFVHTGRENTLSFHREKAKMETKFPHRVDNAPPSPFPECEQEPLLRPHLSAFRLQPQHSISTNFFFFKKMGKQHRSASALPSATEPLDARCSSLAAFLQWDSSTLQAVWWESRLLCGSSASRTQHCQERRDGGILHTTALLSVLLSPICIWPHSNSGWN